MNWGPHAFKVSILLTGSIHRPPCCNDIWYKCFPALQNFLSGCRRQLSSQDSCSVLASWWWLLSVNLTTAGMTYNPKMEGTWAYQLLHTLGHICVLGESIFWGLLAPEQGRRWGGGGDEGLGYRVEQGNSCCSQDKKVRVVGTLWPFLSFRSAPQWCSFRRVRQENLKFNASLIPYRIPHQTTNKPEGTPSLN